MKSLLVPGVSLSVLLCAFTLQADVVKLKDGRTIQGIFLGGIRRPGVAHIGRRCPPAGARFPRQDLPRRSDLADRLAYRPGTAGLLPGHERRYPCGDPHLLLHSQEPRLLGCCFQLDSRPGSQLRRHGAWPHRHGTRRLPPSQSLISCSNLAAYDERRSAEYHPSAAQREIL